MLGIMNAALSAQGEYEITENDGSDEFRALSRNWPLIVEAALEDGLYNFTKQEANLLTRSDGKWGFEDAYLLPGDVLHVRQLWIEETSIVRSTVDWVQDGTHVHLDNPDGCWIEYVNVPEVDVWSATFSLGIRMKLEAVILRIKEEIGEALRMEEAADRKLADAATISSKARRAQGPYRRGSIAAARFSRGAG